MPGEAQALDVAEEAVADALDKALRTASQVIALAEAAHAPEYRHSHHSQRRVQKGLGRIFPQLLQGQKPRKEIRGLGRLAAEDIVHSDLDDLRRQGVKSHTQAGAEQRRHKKAHHGLEKPPDERRLLPAGQLPLRLIHVLPLFLPMGAKKAPLPGRIYAIDP